MEACFEHTRCDFKKKVPQHIFKFGPFNIVSFGTFGPTKVLETALLSVFH